MVIFKIWIKKRCQVDSTTFDYDGSWFPSDDAGDVLIRNRDLT